MRAWVLVGLLAACERAGDSQNPLGTGGANEPAPTGPRVIADAGIATMPNDAAKVAVVVDAAVPKPAPKPAPKDAVAMSLDDAKRFADLLTVDSPRSNDQDMSRRRPTADLGKQIDDARSGGNRPTLGVGGRGTRGGGDGRVGTARVGVGGGTSIDSPGQMKGDEPTGRISVSSKRTNDESSLTVDVALAKIQSAYMAGLRRCYKSGLKTDPNLRGRLTLAFGVDEGGRVVNPKATGFSAPVDECITKMMASWRFPIPKDKDGEPTSATFEYGLNLVPE